jgi:hypothetical protein
MELPRTGAADSANHLKSGDARTEAILKVAREGERFLVCSLRARWRCMPLEHTGKRVDLVSPDRIPVVYRSLPGAAKIGKSSAAREQIVGEFRAALEGRQELRAGLNLLA